MRTPGKRVCRKATRVRIPAHPRSSCSDLERSLSAVDRSPSHHLNILPHLHYARARQDAAKIRSRIDKAIPPQDGPRIDHRITTDLRPVSHDGAKFGEPGGDVAIRRADVNFLMIQLHV